MVAPCAGQPLPFLPSLLYNNCHVFHFNRGGGARDIKGLAALTGSGRLHALRDSIIHRRQAGKTKVQDQLSQLGFGPATW